METGRIGDNLAIQIENLNYIYSPNTAYKKHAIKDVNLTINDGEFIGLIGHTGSGKSTLIQHLNGLIKATSGRILVNGENIYKDGYKMVTLRSKIGLVFQYPEHQLFETTVLKDVNFGPMNLGITPIEAELRSIEALKQVGVSEELWDVSPFELSGGQKRRVAIAGVLAMQPQVLILDEPTAGLDPMGRDEILGEIAKLHREKKITVILVSHSMEDVAEYVDRIIVMNKGNVAMDGLPGEVFSRYKELEAMGLGAPQVTYVMDELRKQGFEYNKQPTTVAEAKEVILSQALRQKRLG